MKTLYYLNQLMLLASIIYRGHTMQHSVLLITLIAFLGAMMSSLLLYRSEQEKQQLLQKCRDNYLLEEAGDIRDELLIDRNNLSLSDNNNNHA